MLQSDVLSDIEIGPGVYLEYVAGRFLWLRSFVMKRRFYLLVVADCPSFVDHFRGFEIATALAVLKQIIGT